MGPRMLVTGSTGLVGANLVRSALAAGWRVRALSRAASNPLALQGLEIEHAVGDLRDAASLQTACRDCDAVVHAAADVRMRRDPAAWAAMREVNVEGTRRMLTAAREAGVPRFVQVSSVDAIGFSTPEGYGASPEKPSHEGVAYANDRFGLPYMRTKHESEELARAAAAAGQHVVIVNPTFMFGAWDTKPTSGRMILEVARGRALAWMAGGNNFVDVEDVCTGILAALERGVPGERYILGNENLGYREMLTRIAAVVGARPPRFGLPRWLTATAGAVAGGAFRLGLGDGELNLGAARVSNTGHYYDPGRARRELGMPASSVDAAVERAWHWFRKHGYA